MTEEVPKSRLDHRKVASNHARSNRMPRRYQTLLAVFPNLDFLW